MNRLLKTFAIILISTSLIIDKVSSQNNYEDIQQQLINDDEDNINYLSNTYEELEELKDNPLNLNTITKNELEMFPFLTDQIIENILYYIYRYGPMLSSKELFLIEDINRQTIEMLLPYVYVQSAEKEKGLPTLKNLFKYGKSELSTRVDIPLYTRKGYYLNDVDKRYQGGNFYNNIRYQFTYGQRVIFGITCEKDFGEPLFSKDNKKGYDFYSIYFLMKNIKRINSLAIGNYRVNYGYGMVINMDMFFGKSSALYTIERRKEGIKKHSSTDEYNYLQGIAMSYKLSKKIDIDLFASYRNMDGIVDSMFITSLKKDGYHRLINEFEKKNRLSNSLIGTNLSYNGTYFECGITAVYNVFNKLLNPDYKYYNVFYPRGKEFYNVGVNYKLFLKKIIFSGECAVDKNGAIATINMFSYSPNYKMRFILMNRFYDAKYQSLYANSVSEGSTVQNESGVYIGMEYNILDKLQVSGYGDMFYFPNKKYMVEKYGTNGYDFNLQTVYSPINKLRLLIRYKQKDKYKNYSSNSDKIVIPYIQRRAKLQINWDINTVFSSTTTLEACLMNYKDKPSSKGFVISQSANIKLSTIPIELYLHCAYFNTDSYEARISLYEKAVKYAFSIPSFYYKGFRGAINIKYSIFKNITLYGKFASTLYFNRDNIGSSNDLIIGNVKSDINIMLCYKF